MTTTTLADAATALQTLLDRAKRADRTLRKGDITNTEKVCVAPYAKERRLLLDTISRRHNVLAVGVPAANGSYRQGYFVELFGYESLVDAALSDYEAAEEHAFASLAGQEPLPGEDPGTYKSSFLLGYRLGLAGEPLEREQVEEAVRAPITDAPGVAMRSTGSGAWAGYVAATSQARRDSENLREVAA